MSDPRGDPVQDLAAAYALGALPPEEARRFEALLASSPEMQREVAEFREAAALLALEHSSAAPDPALRLRMLERIGREKATTSAGGAAAPSTAPLVRRRSPWLVGALAASLAALVGLGAALLGARGELAETRRQLAEREATLESILAPDVRMVQLTATGDPDPGLQLFWDTRRGRAVLHGYRLSAVPAGRAYQLWFIQDGAPVPSVTFTPGPDGRVDVRQVQLPVGGDVSAAAVTVEPQGGSPAPTSPILLVGKLQPS